MSSVRTPKNIPHLWWSQVARSEFVYLMEAAAAGELAKNSVGGAPRDEAQDELRSIPHMELNPNSCFGF